MKSFSSYMQLQEIGNQPYRWKRTLFTEQVWQAVFVADNKQKYVFKALKVGASWEALFHAVGREDDSMGITGTQGTSALRVFSTVAKIFETFMKEKSAGMVSFTADKTERDGKSVRTKLYSRFAKSFAKKHGYRMSELDKRDEIHFVFSKERNESLEEKKVPLFVSRPYKGSHKTENISGVENPSAMETLGFVKKLRFGMARFIVDKLGKLLIWDADNAIHQEVVTGEGWDRNETTLGVMDFVGGSKHDNKDLVIRIFTPKGGEKKSRTLQALKKRDETVWEVT